MGTIDFTPAANNDLSNALLDLLEFSRNRAVPLRFNQLLDEKLALLAAHKLAGEACPMYGIENMRQFPVRGFHYVIFYRPSSSGIEVLRIVHGSRDMQKIKFDDSP